MSAHYIEAGKEVIRSEPNRRLPGFVRFGQTNGAPRELFAEYFLYRLNGSLSALVQISAVKTDSVSFRVNDLGHKSFIEGVIP